MNFLKNAYKKLFGSSQQSEDHPVSGVEKVEVPHDILEQIFKITSQLVHDSKVQCSDDVKLRAYGFYKQATIGDCNTPRPPLYDFKNKSKWDAWNEHVGMTKEAAMKHYIGLSAVIDCKIPTEVKKILEAECEEHQHDQQSESQKTQETQAGKNRPLQQKPYSGTAKKVVEQVDYSDKYSHPYFKPIIKNEPLPPLQKQLLLQVNNSPAVYPLHFAIEHERIELVSQIMSMLTVEEIKQMKDEEGTGVLEYAQLMENEEVISIVMGFIGGTQ